MLIFNRRSERWSDGLLLKMKVLAESMDQRSLTCFFLLAEALARGPAQKPLTPRRGEITLASSVFRYCLLAHSERLVSGFKKEKPVNISAVVK
jgi:hypothetical protein